MSQSVVKLFEQGMSVDEIMASRKPFNLMLAIFGVVFFLASLLWLTSWMERGTSLALSLPASDWKNTIHGISIALFLGLAYYGRKFFLPGENEGVRLVERKRRYRWLLIATMCACATALVSTIFLLASALDTIYHAN